MKALPKSLGAQLVALLFAALVASQALTLWVLSDERTEALWQANRTGLLERTASALRMLELAPTDMRAPLAEAAGSRRIRFWVSDDSAVAAATRQSGPLAMQFDRMLGSRLRAPPRLAFLERDEEAGPLRSVPLPQERGERREWRRRIADERLDLVVSVPLRDAGWLNAQTRMRGEPIGLPWPSLVSTAAMALAILLIVAFMARRVTRPLGALAANADAFGRGAPVSRIPETGPDEVRRLTAAFNGMQERLHRFIADRTRMLAAIGHDLRTPITSLRLRAELVDDDETREKMLATLGEMQAMTEAALDFARQDARPEEMRRVDLAALLSSVADDLAEVGMDVTVAEAARLPYACRPNALRRAIRNLIQNAVQYGTRARVSLADTPAGPIVAVEDDGPGIPDGRLADVFEPFVRLEASRSRETGGVGLGLAIARSVVRSHGGDIVLANRAEGGLRAEIRLPRLLPEDAATAGG